MGGLGDSIYLLSPLCQELCSGGLGPVVWVIPINPPWNLRLIDVLTTCPGSRCWEVVTFRPRTVSNKAHNLLAILRFALARACPGYW